MSGWGFLASKHPFSFLKSGAAPFFTRILRYFLFLQKGCWVRRFFREAQSLPKLRAQSAFEAQSVSTKRGRDLRHDPPNPPQTARGPKKNQNAFQLPLVSGHPAAPEGPEPIIPLLTLFWGSGGGPGGALRPKARSAWRA